MLANEDTQEKLNNNKKGSPIGEPLFLWVLMDSNHRSRKTADLQSAPFGHSGKHPSAVKRVQRYDKKVNTE